MKLRNDKSESIDKINKSGRKSKISKRAKRITAFILIFVVIFEIITNIIPINECTSVANIKGFYKEPKNSLDVVLIGPSEFYADYSATQAWKEYGYTSYSLAIGGIPGNMYKSMLIETLKRQSPKLVVFELNGFMQNDAYYERAGKLHTWIDNMPWSENKIQTIKENVPKKDRYSYYFNFTAYHTNWKDIKNCGRVLAVKAYMLLHGQAYTKGFGTYTEMSDSVADAGSKNVEFTSKSEEYLRDLLSYCKQNGVEHALFVRFPHGRKISNPEEMEKMQEVIESYGYDYLNLNEAYEKIGIDKSKDFYNPEHLNVNGMEKMTRYFGGYICDNYNVAGDHTLEQIKNWNRCAKKTDMLIARCKSDLDTGVHRRYSELSVKKGKMKVAKK